MAANRKNSIETELGKSYSLVPADLSVDETHAAFIREFVPAENSAVWARKARNSVKKEKLRISANEVLKDIRSGMDDEGLMLKYHITFRQLQSLLRKMIKAGYVSPLELAQRLCITESQVTEAFDRVTKAIKELD